MSEAIITALVAAMTTLAPPARLARGPAWPGWEETAEARLERYVGIAGAAYRVAFDPGVAPVYPGKDGRKKTASLLLGIAFAESGFAPDVDRGPCYRGKDGKGVRCDSGRSACLMQIQIGAGVTAEGWTQADLFADRERCFRAGLALVRKSFVACAKEGDGHALDAYATGVCGSIIAQAKSRPRLALGRRVYDLAFPRSPGPDALFLVPVEAPTTTSPPRLAAAP